MTYTPSAYNYIRYTALVKTVSIPLTTNVTPLSQCHNTQYGMARVLKGFHSFICTPTRSSAIGMGHTCLCLPSRSWYLFTDPRRDGRLSRPWCEVAQAEIRTRNLPIANPALYRTSTSAPERFCGGDSLRRGALSSVCTFTFTFTMSNISGFYCIQR